MQNTGEGPPKSFVGLPDNQILYFSSLLSLPGRTLHRPGIILRKNTKENRLPLEGQVDRRKARRMRGCFIHILHTKKEPDDIRFLLYAGSAYLSSLQVSFMATEQAMSPRTLQQVAPISHRVFTLM